jgi:hypothetical protein
MKSSLESLPSVSFNFILSEQKHCFFFIQISDSGVVFDSVKSSQQTVPLKSPTETRSVHFPLIDLSNELISITSTMSLNNNNSSYDQSSNLTLSQNVGLSNSIIRQVRNLILFFFVFKTIFFSHQ